MLNANDIFIQFNVLRIIFYDGFVLYAVIKSDGSVINSRNSYRNNNYPHLIWLYNELLSKMYKSVAVFCTQFNHYGFYIAYLQVRTFIKRLTFSKPSF